MMMNQLNHSIGKSKQDYHDHIARKMSDPNTGVVCYWPLFKTFLNGKKMFSFSYTREQTHYSSIYVSLLQI